MKPSQLFNIMAMFMPSARVAFVTSLLATSVLQEVTAIGNRLQTKNFNNSTACDNSEVRFNLVSAEDDQIPFLCRWVKKGTCKQPGTLASHCPGACEACNMYGCANSEGTFNWKKKKTDCNWLANLKNKCKMVELCKKPKFFTTCRETCNSCAASFSPSSITLICTKPSTTPTSKLCDTWSQIGSDIIREDDSFVPGTSASMSGDGTTVAIVVYYTDGNDIFVSPHVRVLRLNSIYKSWSQIGEDIDFEASFDFSSPFNYFRLSLSDDGNVVAIGAQFNDGNGNNAGHVRVFKLDDTIWVQMGGDIDGEAANESSGSSTSLSGDGTIVAIGAEGSNGNKGHVRVFKWDDTTWVQMGGDIDGETANDSSGGSVSLSSGGNIVAIGAKYNDGNKGHVRVFKWDGYNLSWFQMGGDIDGEAANDFSGKSVSLSGDGNIVAIGAEGNTGNGFSAGHVRVFKWNDTTWAQMGGNIDGEDADDYFGSSVSLSDNGNIVAIGAVFNNVRVFEWNSDSSWIQIGSDIDGEALATTFVSLSNEGKSAAIVSDSPYVRVFQQLKTSCD